MDNKITLLCLLAGKPTDNGFLVDIGKDQLVSHLQKEIKIMNRSFSKVNLQELTSLMVNVLIGDGTALPDLSTLKKYKLRFAQKIDKAFSGLSEKNIHVIVKTPDSTAFRKEELSPIGR